MTALLHGERAESVSFFRVGEIPGTHFVARNSKSGQERRYRSVNTHKAEPVRWSGTRWVSDGAQQGFTSTDTVRKVVTN